MLANRIRQNKDIRGISIGSKEQKLSLFADDCTGIIKDQSSILKLLEEIDRYTKYSGLRLNAPKSEIYVIKDSKTQIAREIPLKILKDDIRLLGITIGRNVYQQEQDKIETKISSMEKTFNRWSQRQLTTIGRIMISKTHGVSKIIHTMAIKPVPKQQLTKIQKLINQYIWCNKPSKVNIQLYVLLSTEGV